jgi:hypothetical protein
MAPGRRGKRIFSGYSVAGARETLGYYLLAKPARSWELPAAQVKQTAQS